MHPWATSVIGRSLVYVRNNAKVETACDTGTFLTQQGAKVMDWSALSLNINPIEHFWNRRGSWSETWMTPFYRAIIVACCALGVGCSSPKKGEHLVESMRCRVCALLATRGGHTMYSWYGDMDVSMFNRFIKNAWLYAIWLPIMTPLLECTTFPLWSYLDNLCYFTSCRANSRLGPKI